MNTRWPIRQAAAWLKAGGVIAYPTEAIYGLGCDPLNQAAVTHLLALKQRNVNKGLIMIADNYERIEAFLQPLMESQQELLRSTWPGPVTWLIPAQNWVPKWLTGSHNTLAVRVTAHPTAVQLCQAADMPIISTSANISHRRPARNILQVHRQFGPRLDYILSGHTGGLAAPTVIRDLTSGKTIRAA